jgi:hypothetical protein
MPRERFIDQFFRQGQDFVLRAILKAGSDIQTWVPRPWKRQHNFKAVRGTWKTGNAFIDN